LATADSDAGARGGRHVCRHHQFKAKPGWDLWRLIIGLRLYLDAARRFPLFARFITGAGPQAIGPDNPVYKYIPTHIEEAIKAGEFIDVPVRVTLDMVGAGLIAVARISSGRADDSYLGAMMSALARSLGLDHSRAAELVSELVTALELDASLARAESCASQPDEADGERGCAANFASASMRRPNSAGLPSPPKGQSRSRSDHEPNRSVVDHAYLS
jgi:hypothetical protein